MTRCFVRFALPIAVGLLTGPYSWAQSPSIRPAFDVASIKISNNCGNSGGPGGTSPGRLNLPCASLRGLIRMAYSAFANETLSSRRVEVLGGPSWIDTEHYDVFAKVEGDPTPAQMVGPMLRTLLEERFNARAHLESRESPVYALTLAKDSAKLQVSKEGSCTPLDLNHMPTIAPKAGELTPKYCGTGEMTGSGGASLIADWHGVSMDEFAGRMLSNFVDRAVIDKTGLTGRFDVHLEFVRDDARSRPISLNGVDSPSLAESSADATGPSIFTALRRQLGLKLVPEKGFLQVVVVDHAERPSGN